MATYGEGDPTDNAQDFYDWLQETDVDLTGVKFAVSPHRALWAHASLWQLPRTLAFSCGNRPSLFLHTLTGQVASSRRPEPSSAGATPRVSPPCYQLVPRNTGYGMKS